jgi:hypothetical protein
MTEEAVAAHERRLKECLDRRNRLEVLASGITIAILLAGAVLVMSQGPSMRDLVSALGCLLLAAGLGAIVWRVRSHVAVQRSSLPRLDAKARLAERLRSERDLLASVWTWYVGPLLPGFLLLWGGALFSGNGTAAVLGTVATAAVIWWVVRQNRRAAASFDRQLREIGAEPA